MPDTITTGGATKADVAAMKRRARAAEDPYKAAYEAGVEEGRESARPARKRSTSTSSTRTSRHPAKGRAARRGRRPHARRSSPARRAARQLQAPVRAQVVGGLRTVGLSLSVVGLFLFLENASAVSGFLGGVARGLEWLRSPDASIPFGQQAG